MIHRPWQSGGVAGWAIHQRQRGLAVSATPWTTILPSGQILRLATFLHAVLHAEPSRDC